MYIKCPYCCSNDTKSMGGRKYKCLSCDSLFEEGETTSSSYIPPRGTSGNSIRNTGMGGEKIYEQCISGVAAIICQDLGCCGSGFLIDRKGLVITNAHVVLSDSGRPSRRIVCYIDENEVPAQIIRCGSVDGLDIAVLQLASVPRTCSPLKLGDSSRCRNGERVYHIGNSLGEGLCITSGIISDKNRHMGNNIYIMTDVAINPGNSGGPLIDDSGIVVGVCVAGRVGADGMKFSIPINEVKTFIRGL